MRKTLLTLLLLAVVAAAIWYGPLRPGQGPALAGAGPDTTPAHDFEAQEVLLRQMDATGRLLFEVQAERITQLRGTGAMQASGLTLRHDPPGTAEGSPQRWILTAERGQLQPDGQLLDLSGQVQASGLPAGSQIPLQLRAGSLRYDLSSQELVAEEDVQFSWGRYAAQGRGLKVNVADGVLQLKWDIHGTISL